MPLSTERHARHAKQHLQETKLTLKGLATGDDYQTAEPISIAHPDDPKAVVSARAADDTARFVVNYQTPDTTDIHAPRHVEKPQKQRRKTWRRWICCRQSDISDIE